MERSVIEGAEVAEEFQQIVDDYVRATWGGEPQSAPLDPERRTIAMKHLAY
jgi:hypothetical protein